MVAKVPYFTRFLTNYLLFLSEQYYCLSKNSYY